MSQLEKRAYMTNNHLKIPSSQCVTKYIPAGPDEVPTVFLKFPICSPRCSQQHHTLFHTFCSKLNMHSYKHGPPPTN